MSYRSYIEGTLDNIRDEVESINSDSKTILKKVSVLCKMLNDEEYDTELALDLIVTIEIYLKDTIGDLDRLVENLK